jgi:hypothetical protein
MTGATPTTGSPVRSRVRRLAGVPKEVANISDELVGLRTDVAELRGELLDLTRRLPAIVPDQPVPDQPDPDPPHDAGAGDAPDGSRDDGIELFAERMAVLEDGLDEVGQRLEGMARDGVNLLSAKLEQLSQRVDQLTSRPLLTREQLEEALAHVAGARRSSRG